MYPAIKAALPRSGICGTIHTDMRDGPVSSGGSGVLSLFDSQGTQRTSMIVEQIHRRTTVGNYILQNIEDLVLEAGLYGTIWSMPFNAIKEYIATHSLIFHASSKKVMSTTRIFLYDEYH